MNKKGVYIILVAGLLGLLPKESKPAALLIEAHRLNRVLDCIEVSDNRFSLSFIHSASLTPVTDYYEIAEQNAKLTIFQTGERFVTHGQGLPSMSHEQDVIEFVKLDGAYEVKMLREIPDLIVRVDRRFENELMVNDFNLDLSRWQNLDTGIHIKPVNSCL